MTATDVERAAALADHAARALTGARTALAFAADGAEHVDDLLRRSEMHIEELPYEAARVRVADEPNRHLRSAAGLADDIDQRLHNGQRALEEVDGYLQEGAVALDVGREALTELEKLPGGRSAATEDLRQRLAAFGPVVKEAREGVEEATKRLATARQNLEPLLYPPNHVDDRGRTAATVDRVGSGVQNDVMAVQRRLAGLRDDLDATRPKTDDLAWRSADLATAARAATNPTPAAGRSGPTGPSEWDLRRRGPAAQVPGQER